MSKMTVPFATFAPMHDELREQLDQAYNNVMNSNYFIQGKECEAFDKEFAAYCGAEHCIGVANGLDALLLVLKALEIGAGDEVIVPSNTFIATALAVSYTGATPVFVEPELETYNIDVNRIEAKIVELFSHIEMPADAKERIYYPVEDTPGTIYAIGQDKEQSSTQVQLMFGQLDAFSQSL